MNRHTTDSRSVRTALSLLSGLNPFKFLCRHVEPLRRCAISAAADYLSSRADELPHSCLYEFSEVGEAALLPGPLRLSRRRPALDGVVGGNLEERGGGVAARNVGESVNVLACEWVAVFAQDDDLKFGRVPAFGDDLYGAVVADLAHGDGDGRARTLGLDAFDHLPAELLCLDGGVGGFGADGRRLGRGRRVRQD